MRGSTTFFGARFCRCAVVEKADLHSDVAVGVVREQGCAVLWRAFRVRYLQMVRGRKTGGKAERFIAVDVMREGRNWCRC
jgi:hypothetical protein